MTDSEIELLAQRSVGVSHCVESNLKLASGIAPVVKMLKAGVKVTFGTDSAASNNDLNILSEMSTAAKLHKAVSEDPTVLNAKTVLCMATRWGAEVLGLGKITGSIEKGKAADLVMADLKSPHLIPIYNIYSHIVYSMRPSDIQSVMVNGKLVVNDGKLVTADESEILYKAKKWCEKISGCE
jgi:5-methylthioadenosine/S-adenosylhomocysteine deaminase